MSTKTKNSIVTEIRTYANGFGKWRAELSFEHSLSESDNRPEFNLNSHWSNLRRRARNSIVNEISQREQKTGETLEQAKARIRKAMPSLSVIDNSISSMNTWYGVTFGEA